MTRLPTAAAPLNLPPMVRLPVETEWSNVRATTSYTPTALALCGAKMARLPTATAPANFRPTDRLPMGTDASNIEVVSDALATLAIQMAATMRD